MQTTDESIDHRSAEVPAVMGHVLVADGDTASRERRQGQLLAAGYRVSVARTGFEAIVKATCQVPDLIILDDSLGDIEASETGRLITTCPVTAHIPIIKLTAGRRMPLRAFSRLRRTQA
jgi:CheY-like chemotaxis protein